MSNDSYDYVRRHFDIPAEIVQHVIANGEPSLIMAERVHCIGISFDSDPKKRLCNCHPT